jgi:hypothetical protein
VVVDECLQTTELVYGDGILAECIISHTPTPFTNLPTFHQCDFESDISGLLQSPLEFATLYNLVPSFLPLFPPWHAVGSEYEPSTSYDDAISLFRLSRRILGPQNWGIRYRFGQKGRFVLTNGYSITEFLRPPYPTNHDLREAVEATFPNDNDIYEFTFHARDNREMPMRHGLREGDDKRTYYLRAVEMRDTRASQSRVEEMKLGRQEAAVFVYVNEWGSVRRGIEVVWLW